MSKEAKITATQIPTSPQYVSPTIPERPKNLSPEEYDAYLKHEQAIDEASAPYEEEMEKSKRSWGIEPTEGVSHKVYLGGTPTKKMVTRYRKTPSGPVTFQEEVTTMVGGRWVGFGDKELAQWKQEQWKPFYTSLTKHRATKAKKEAESKQFYESVGYPQFGGKYSPFEIPEGAYVKDITERKDDPFTTEIEAGLNIAFGSHQADKQVTESKQFFEAIKYPQFGGKYSPFEIPEGAYVKDITERKDDPFTTEIEAGLNVVFGSHQADKQVTESKQFYTAIGHPQWGDKYLPFEIPEGAYVKDITEIRDIPSTPEIEAGLNVVFGSHQADKQVTENKQFYTAIGYPQFGSKYSPFEIPEGLYVKDIQETAEGLNISFQQEANESILLGTTSNAELNPYQVAEMARHYGISIQDKNYQQVVKEVTLKSLEDAQTKANLSASKALDSIIHRVETGKASPYAALNFLSISTPKYNVTDQEKANKFMTRFKPELFVVAPTPYQVREIALRQSFDIKGKQFEDVKTELGLTNKEYEIIKYETPTIEVTKATQQEAKQVIGNIESGKLAPVPTTRVINIDGRKVVIPVDPTTPTLSASSFEAPFARKQRILSEAVQKGMIDPLAEKGSLTKAIFDFDPIKVGAGISAALFGYTGKEREQRVARTMQLGRAIDVATEGTFFKKQQESIAGVVGSVESYWNPSVPSFGGAVVSDVADVVLGKTGTQIISRDSIKTSEGTTETVVTRDGGVALSRLEQEWGRRYIAGSVLGDIIQAIVGAKAISAARGTKIGGKVLDPVLKHFDKLNDAITKKIVKPVTTKVSSFYDDVVAKVTRKTPQQVTGWARKKFGTTGYGFDDIVAPKKGATSPFESKLPSVIVDETSERFLTQTARATSKPVGKTSLEQIVYGRGGKPWLVQMKHPPNIIGGGLTRLIDPTKVTLIPTPTILGLKTKIASKMFAATFIKSTLLGPVILSSAILGTSRTLTPTLTTEEITKTMIQTKPIQITRTPQIIVPKTVPSLVTEQATKTMLQQETAQQQRQILVPRQISIPQQIPDVTQVTTPESIQTQKQEQEQIQKLQQVQITSQITRTKPITKTQTTHVLRIPFRGPLLVSKPFFLGDEDTLLKSRKRLGIFGIKLKKQKLKYPIIAPMKLAKQEGYGKLTKTLKNIEKTVTKVKNPFAVKPLRKKSLKKRRKRQ